MSKTLITFDYAGIDKDTKSKLVSLAGDFNRAMREHANAGMAAGKAASQAHELLAGEGKEGSFAGYAEGVLGVSRQTAYNYMWAWDRFGKCKSLLHFSAEAMYALASPKAPPQAAKEAEKLADKGERVNIAKAKELLDKFREAGTRAAKAGNKSTKSDVKTPEARPESAAAPVDAGSDGPAAPPKLVGPCPHGGEHTYDEEACTRCHDPKPKGWMPPEGVTKYNDKFDPPAADEALDLAAKQAPYDDMLNALTQISKTWNAVVKDERDGVYAIDKRQRVEILIRDLRAPIAQARPHGLCSHCEGKGCKKCHNCGWWPRSVVEGLKK